METRYRFFLTKRGDIVDTMILANASLVFHKRPAKEWEIDGWSVSKIRKMFPSIREEVSDKLTPEECLDRGSGRMAMMVYSNINGVRLVEAKKAIDKMREERGEQYV